MTDNCVIDASVVAKWFLKDEPDTDFAEWFQVSARLGTVALHAPAILPFELCNMLARACATRRLRRPRLELEQALFATHAVFGVPIQIESFTPKLASAAMSHAVTFHKTFYDMLYLALAEKLDCVLITADEKLLQAVPSTFPAPRVVLLSSLPKLKLFE